MHTGARVLLLGATVTAAWAQETPVLEFTDAGLRNWVQAEYPAELKKAKREGEVVVEFVVEADGSVSRATARDSTDPQFEAAALKAVGQWTFAPAMEEGKAVASGMEARVPFTAAQWKQTRAPIFPPPALMPRTLKVTPARVIDRDGRARLLRVKSATHEAFGWAAATAISQWVFDRPRRGGEPVDVQVTIPVPFSPPAPTNPRHP